MLVRISPGYSPLTGRLHTCYSPVRRSPPLYCYACAAPRLACVRPVASVHPEPGSNSSLYLFFFFIIPSKRHLTELTSFSLLSCTTLASSIPSMNLAKVPRGVPRFLFCGCKVNAFSYSAPNFFTHFLCCTTYFFYNELYYTHLYLNIFFQKNPNTI